MDAFLLIRRNGLLYVVRRDVLAPAGGQIRMGLDTYMRLALQTFSDASLENAAFAIIDQENASELAAAMKG